MSEHGLILSILAAGLLGVTSQGFASGKDDRPAVQADGPMRTVGAEPWNGFADPTEVASSPQPYGKAGIDRFDLDIGKVRESFKADGTIIVELNGEGMEKLTLTSIDGVPRMVCGSILESWATNGKVPVDFRNHAATRNERHAIR